MNITNISFEPFDRGYIQAKINAAFSDDLLFSSELFYMLYSKFKVDAKLIWAKPVFFP